MTNDINFNAKSKSNSSIMEPIDETPSLTLKVCGEQEGNEEM